MIFLIFDFILYIDNNNDVANRVLTRVSLSLSLSLFFFFFLILKFYFIYFFT